MTVGLKLGSIIDEIGSDDFFHSFFSTVAYHLEDSIWGSRFPIIMNVLYQGVLNQNDASKALAELAQIKEGLLKLKPSAVVWDIEKPHLKPPWGAKISKSITSLRNYFLTSTGKDLIDLLFEIIKELHLNGGKIEIVKY